MDTKKCITTMKKVITNMSNFLICTAVLMLLAGPVHGQDCTVSEHGFYGLQDIRVPELFDAIYFHYQIEYNENEFDVDFDSMLHTLELAMAQRIVDRSSIFEECGENPTISLVDTSSSPSDKETPSFSSRPKDVISTKQCPGPLSDNVMKCVVMDGQMTFFYPESKQTFYEPKISQYNHEIRKILKNGMDEYIYSDYHSIPGIHKLTYLVKSDYDKLLIKEEIVINDETDGQVPNTNEGTNPPADEPKSKGVGLTVALVLLILSATAATLFGVYYIKRKRRSESSTNFQGDSNTDMT